MSRVTIALLAALATVLIVASSATPQNLVDTAWVARYDSPSNGVDQMFGEDNLRVDGSGNVYVLGSSNGIGSGSWDALLIKYTPAGVKEWNRTGPGGGQELGHKLELDAAGLPHVCFTEQIGDYEHTITSKYTPDGDTIWVRSYNPPDSGNTPQALRIDSSGNVIVIANLVSLAAYKGRVLKYDSGGNLLWARSWPDSIDGIPAGSLASACDLDDAGNVYVATWALSGMIGLLKYSPSGDLLWHRAQICGNTHSVAELSIIGARIHMTGGSNCEGLYAPFAAIYSTDGDSLWTDREAFEGQTTTSGATDLIVSEDGGVFLIGNYSIASQKVVGAIRYDSDGNLLWKKTYGSPGGMEAHDISLDSVGSIYLSGASRVSLGGYRQYMLLKCNSAGDSLLTLLHQGGTGCDANIMVAHRVDIAGNIHVGGYSQCTGGNYDIFTIKYSPRCDCFGDPACDNVVADVVDVVSVVGVAFRGAPSTHDADCYRDRMDLDCSGGIDIIDVVKIVEVAFRGVTPEGAFCDPTSF